MQKISVVIITFNEEKYVEQCIKSVELIADEIIVVDSFSFDRTKEICLEHEVRFIENSFKGYRDHTNLSPECKIRLFNRKKGQWGGFNIHEKLILDNPKNVHHLKGNLLHWLYDSYEESIEKMNSYTTIIAHEYFRQGYKSKTIRLLISPLW